MNEKPLTLKSIHLTLESNGHIGLRHVVIDDEGWKHLNIFDLTKLTSTPVDGSAQVSGEDAFLSTIAIPHGEPADIRKRLESGETIQLYPPPNTRAAMIGEKIILFPPASK